MSSSSAYIVAQKNENADHQSYAAQAIADTIDVVAHGSDLAPLASDVPLNSRHMTVEVIQERSELE